jgi:uncharacterized membrane protein
MKPLFMTGRFKMQFWELDSYTRKNSNDLFSCIDRMVADTQYFSLLTVISASESNEA